MRFKAEGCFEERDGCPGSDNEEDTFSTSRPCGARGMGEKITAFKRVSGTLRSLQELVSVK